MSTIWMEWYRSQAAKQAAVCNNPLKTSFVTLVFEASFKVHKPSDTEDQDCIACMVYLYFREGLWLSKTKWNNMLYPERKTLQPARHRLSESGVNFVGIIQGAWKGSDCTLHGKWAWAAWLGASASRLQQCLAPLLARDNGDNAVGEAPAII